MSPAHDDDAAGTVFSRPGLFPTAGPAPDLGHYLLVVEGPEPGKCVELSETPVTIGRDQQRTLVVADTQVSRLHARVTLVGDDVVLEDLGSTNGTFLGTKRLTEPVTLREGQVFRVGPQLLKYERRSRREVERTQELDRDLERARDYVLSLLPAPIDEGPVRTDWRYVPSAQLGGDAFGYYWLDPATFVFYLVDVSGHGVGAAMHSVSVLNVLRQRALPGVDFAHPDQVLASLNDRFQMDTHGGLFFTIWYGVYRTGDRTIACGSAGHHAAYLVPPGRTAAEPIGVSSLLIGAMPGMDYETRQTAVPAGSTLFVFSDGVFEIATADGSRWALSDFLPRLVTPPVPGTTESERLYQEVRRAAAPGPLEDDFSLLVVMFP
jgi:serine phosphatase RsbU (regulator of sigma subunit)